MSDQGGIENIFSGGAQQGNQDVADAFGNAMNQLPGYFQHGVDQLSPWAQGGQAAFGKYGDFIDSLKGGVDDPGAWMKGYSESPQAKYETDAALNAANNAAAGAGLLGGLGSRTGDMNIAQGIASKDMQNYFNNMMSQRNQYGQGLADMSHMGLGASTNIADLWKALGGDMASLITGQGAAQGAADQAGTSGKNSAVGSAIGNFGGIF